MRGGGASDIVRALNVEINRSRICADEICSVEITAESKVSTAQEVLASVEVPKLLRLKGGALRC